MGVNVDAVNSEEALERMALFLREPRGHAVFTPNPEMLALAWRDRSFRVALNSADLAVPDGSGLLWAARVRRAKLPERVTGTDMVERLCRHAAASGDSIFFLGGSWGTAESAAHEMQVRYPGLRVVGVADGGKVTCGQDGVPLLTPEVKGMIEQARPEILLVAFGHGKQEQWIMAHLTEFPSVRVAMGVGGAFDFLSGRVKRAPEWMRKAHLEWFWRLLLQPWRIRRILTATVMFPSLVLGERFGIINQENDRYGQS